MPITPYTGPFGRPELQHLLRRSLFGCTAGDRAHFEGMSLNQVVDELLTFTNDTTPPLRAYTDDNGDPNGIDVAVPFGSTWVDTPVTPLNDTDVIEVRIRSFAAWWMGQMTGQERNLREKLTLFWHNHLPTQVSIVYQSEMQYRQNQLLRTRCKGNFKQLIHDVSVEPAMLYYLNGYLNIAAAPDENYARELFELFTLGQGSGYTEADVQAAARVLTGWTFMVENGGTPVLPQTLFFPPNHTASDKQFSAFFNNTVIQGQTGPDAGEVELNALLDMILAVPECSRFICRELYRFFVHGEISEQAEADVIAPLAELFRENVDAPDQMAIVVRALLTSDHFFSSAIRGCMVKNPVDLVVGDLRLFGFPIPDPDLVEARYQVDLEHYWLTAYAGMNLMAPPNVAGWPAYYLYPSYDELWLDTATYPQRNNSLLAVIYANIATPSDTVQPGSANLEFQVDIIAFVQQLSDPADPNTLIDDLVDLLYVNPISDAVKLQLKHFYLLFGQVSDIYWTEAYEAYIADPNTTNMTAQLVPDILRWLIGDMQKAAERHLF
ncbi:MAG TPA: DUF1800 domain-containing protein [Flavobacteriales bacterium]|nr:DUF1800 domain-containing protein [Flavobacteriales bacterium]